MKNTTPLAIHRVPSALRQFDQWVLWRYVTRGDRPTKVPFAIDGSPAKSNDPNTWAPFADVQAMYESRPADFAGVGFMFSADDPFCGIDLDGCRDPETGKTLDWARKWLDQFQTYAEVSPSGSGWKLFCEGKNPFPNGRKNDLDGDPVGGKKPGVEIYDRLRWFALTGWRAKFEKVIPCQQAIDAFCHMYWPVQPQHGATPQRFTGLDPDVFDRARKYVAAMPPAISGSGGHNAAFKVACVLVLGFGLSPEQSFPIFCEFNERCQPPWSEKEIWHKLNSANKQPGDRFWLRNSKPSQWKDIPIPDYVAPEAKTASTSRSKPKDNIRFTTLKKATDEYLDAIAEERELIDLGLPELNYAVGGGVELGEMVIVAARPSHGKSAFALQTLHRCAADGVGCLIVSEEMSKRALAKRTIQYASSVPVENWARDKVIVGRHLERHFSHSANVHVVENCRTAENAANAVRRAVKDHGVKIVAIDYAQLLMSKGKGRYEQVSNTSVILRQVANENNVLLLVLCQLSRDIEKRAGGGTSYQPRLTDLRDSGQLEQDADVIVFLVWPHRIDPKEPPDKYQIFVAKNRNRPINCPAFNCVFNPSRQKFTEEPPEGLDPKYLDDFELP